METKNQLRNLLADGKTLNVIERLISLTQNDKSLQNQAISLSARYKKYLLEKHGNTESNVNLDVELNRINVAALELIGQLSKESHPSIRKWDRNKTAFLFGILASLILILCYTVDFKNKKVKNEVEAHFSLQPFHLLAEATEPPVILDPIVTTIDEILNIDSLITNRLIQLIQPDSQININLAITGDYLISSSPVLAYIHFGIFTPLQQGPYTTVIDQHKPLDLSEFANSRLYFNPVDSTIAISIRDNKRNLKGSIFKVYKTGSHFSLNQEKMDTVQELKLTPNASTILINSIKVIGVSEEDRDRFQATILTRIRRRLKSHSFVKLSPLSRRDIERKRNEIRQLPVGYGKYKLTKQYNVDFIISGEIIFSK